METLSPETGSVRLKSWINMGPPSTQLQTFGQVVVGELLPVVSPEGRASPHSKGGCFPQQNSQSLHLVVIPPILVSSACIILMSWMWVQSPPLVQSVECQHQLCLQAPQVPKVSDSSSQYWVLGFLVHTQWKIDQAKLSHPRALKADVTLSLPLLGM